MLLALNNRFARLAVAATFVSFALPTCSQSQTQRVVANNASPASLGPASLDPTRDALLAFGADGEAIQQARAEVLDILSDSSPCSAWFQAAEPRVADKFRSLRFEIDTKGIAEILKLTIWRDDGGYYQPYVARTGEGVGWGSTITLNANGAFFKKMAPVRTVSSMEDTGYRSSPEQPLRIGGFAGATLPARIVAMLHELGHIVNLLPVDSGVPSGPSISVQNTEKVLHYCGAQIRSHKKPSHATSVGTIVSATGPVMPDTFALQPRPRGNLRW